MKIRRKQKNLFVCVISFVFVLLVWLGFGSVTPLCVSGAQADSDSVVFIGDGSQVGFADAGFTKVNGAGYSTNLQFFQGQIDESDLPNKYRHGVVTGDSLPVGATGSALKFYTHSWASEAIKLTFGTTVNIDEISQLEFRVYFRIANTQAKGCLFLCSAEDKGENGTSVLVDLSEYGQGEWLTIVVRGDSLEKLKDKNGKFNSMILAYATSGGGNTTPYGYFYIDEITARTACTVTYEYGNGKANVVQQVHAGEKLQQPQIPTQNGKVFAGWYDGDKAYDFSKRVERDLTLSAKWFTVDTANALTGVYQGLVNTDKYICLNADGRVEFIRFLTQNGTFVNAQEGIVVYSDGVSIIEKVDDKLVFDNEEFSKIDSVSVEYADGAFKAISLYPVGAVVMPLDRESTESKRFIGWVSAVDGKSFDFSTPIVESISVYAKYESTYIADSEYAKYAGYYYSVEEDIMIALQENKVATLTRAGQENSWAYGVFVDGSLVIWLPNGIYNATVVPAGLLIGSQTYVRLGDYTIRFVDGANVYSVEVKAGEVLQKPADPVKQGYVFEGWYADGDENAFAFGEVVYASRTLYAKWSVDKNATDLTRIALTAGIIVLALGVVAVGFLATIKFIKKAKGKDEENGVCEKDD